MKTILNNRLQYVPPVSQPIDDLSDLPYRPAPPLPAKSFAMYICGQPASGKTTLWNSMLISHPTKKKPEIPRFYYRFFDKCFLISPSMNTLPLNKLRLNEERMFLKFNDETLEDIIETEREDENLNNLIILDDCIRDLTKSKILCKTILNRRHATQNPQEEGQSGLAIMITSQKYNALPLMLRCNMSHIIVFRTENQKELNAIKEELMGDLDDKTANEVLKTAWNKKHGFLFIDATKPTKDRYYQNFNKILIKVDSPPPSPVSTERA
tara:strand:- start:3597 stop:4397 length:801 start_codon:yes stop_codon:yes gene_type:complete